MEGRQDISKVERKKDSFHDPLKNQIPRLRHFRKLTRNVCDTAGWKPVSWSTLATRELGEDSSVPTSLLSPHLGMRKEGSSR